MRLLDKVALITGGTAGIGLATARLFVQEGANVVVSGRNQQRGHEAIEAIREKGSEVVFVQGDVSRSEAARRMVAAASETYGRLDILVNNVGLTKIAVDGGVTAGLY